VPPRQAGGFDLIDQADHAVAVDAERVGELLLGLSLTTARAAERTAALSSGASLMQSARSSSPNRDDRDIVTHGCYRLTCLVAHRRRLPSTPNG